MEFIVNNLIRIHPMALVHFDELEGRGGEARDRGLTRGYADKPEYFVDKLSPAASRGSPPRIIRTR
jgi:pyruvate, water dikinase